MKETKQLNINDTEEILTIAKALSSEPRLRILKLLDNNVMNISEIAARLDMPVSSTALHIRLLEDAGLVITQPLPGIRGSQKLSGVRVESVTIDIKPSSKIHSPFKTYYSSMPIGNYFDVDIKPPCGIVSKEGFLSADDDVGIFYRPDHVHAQLIWFAQGYLEYRFDNTQLKRAHSLREVEISFEACSEAQGYNNNWPSDITLWISHKEVGTFTSPGDFGGTRGIRNPVWWSETLTQYGQLYLLTVNEEGCFINGTKTSDETLHTLNLLEDNCICFRIGVKKDARYVGGMNLFGSHFGNTNQHINLKVDYLP